MDHINVIRLSEDHFDDLVTSVGGRRAVPDSSIEKAKNADYILDDAPIELKLLEEEGLDGPNKATRRQRVAELFQPTQPALPVIVVDPCLLDDTGRRVYYNLMGRPIQNGVKQAADQLETTKAQFGLTGPRIMVAINVGYTGLSQDEFRAAVIKSAQNDTKQIDGVVIGGVYHYSDKFESWTIWPFEYVPINLATPFTSFEKLRRGWHDLSGQVMTAVVKGTQGFGAFDKAPVQDITFDLGGKTFVKPSPNVGRPSNFWKNGRPRENSTGITSSPAVARVYPDLAEETWAKLKAALPDSTFLEESYQKYRVTRNIAVQEGDPLQPVVGVPVPFERVLATCQAKGCDISERMMHQASVDIFPERALSLIRTAVDRESSHVLPNRYIAVNTIEVGQDVAFDTASIKLVDELAGTTRAILRHERIFHEYAMTVAAAYAVRHGVDVIVYGREQTYKWL